MTPIGKVYNPVAHPHTSRLQAVVALSGLDIEFTTEFQYGITNRNADYLSKFPLGKFPALEIYATPQRSTFYLTETNAITAYLSSIGTRKTQLLGSTLEDRALVDQWLYFIHEHVHYGGVMPLARMAIGIKPYDAEVEKSADEELGKWLAYVEGKLGESKSGWLIDVEGTTGPSLADVSLAASLRLGFIYAIDKEQREVWPKVMEWWGRLLEVKEVKETFKIDKPLLEKRAFPRKP